ncbi:MAG: hypothetical protein H8E48_04830 [Chloroflexi bacterium]|nr:hypothetical protein [Chloroflexota bacterium]
MPGIVIAGLLATGTPEAAGIVGILTAIFLVPVFLGALTARLSTATMDATADLTAAIKMTELAPEVIADIESIPGLELVESVPVAPNTEVSLQASMVTGDCAHGYLSGDTWVIDSKGNVSRPICAAAAEGFKALYEASSGEGMPTEISCHCPLADRKVMFKLTTED